MALPNFASRGYILPILTKKSKEYISFGLKEIKVAFENAVNNQGKDLVFLSGEPNFFKEERIEDNITYIVYKSDGEDAYSREYYTLNGKLHRENGPAYFIKSDDITIEYAYFKNGKLHNEMEPAVMHINHPEEKKYTYWYNDEFLTKEKFNKVLRKNKLQKINKSRNV